MKESSPFWPRGLLLGGLLAAFLITPVAVVMMFDSAAEPPPPAGPHLAQMSHPWPLHAQDAFFAGRLMVQAMLAPRFGARLAGGSTPLPAAPRGHLLRLRLENQSTRTLEVEIVRVDSSLGAFVAQPDRLLLAPHENTSIESPVAEQKIPAGAVPVSVALRLGDQVETHQLVLSGRFLTQARN